MFQHILIPTDGSLLSDSALDRGLKLARDSGARVTVVAVTEPFVVLSAEARKIGVSQADHEREVKAAAAGHLAQAARKAAAIGVPCETIEVENEHPHRGIIKTATEKARDHGAGAQQRDGERDDPQRHSAAGLSLIGPAGLQGAAMGFAGGTRSET